MPMQLSNEYIHAGNAWNKDEDFQLIKEYNVDKLKLLEISKIHKRMPGGISSRLVSLKLADMRCNIRGYIEYQQSDLYKEIVKNNIKNNTEKTHKKIIDDTEIIKATIDIKNEHGSKEQFTPRQKYRLELKQVPSEITEIKKDIQEIKENVNKILELMNAVYEFTDN